MLLLLRPSFARLLHRLVAAAGVGLVLALTVFAASPSAHAWLHAHAGGCAAHAHQPGDHSRSSTDAGCAVVLFASGVTSPVGALALRPPEFVLSGRAPITAAEFRWRSPRYLRQPERGPPGAVVG